MIMKQITKWGFGMAPIKEKTDQENRKAIESVKNFVLGNSKVYSGNIIDELSRVKGLFNRIVKQDQWDWFTVYMYFDYPTLKDTKSIVLALSTLRKAITTKDDTMGRSSLKKLQDSLFAVYCDNYLNFDINVETATEYLYILSRREEKDILKIGMTTRNVQKRVNEINSATGVVYPLSARRVFKVKNSKIAEKGIHNLLSEYRIRADREFFKIDYSKACEIIDEYLNHNHLYYYWE